MFTGIVKLETPVIQFIDTDYGKRLTLYLPVDSAKNIEIGCSIAINGACLTVVEFGEITLSESERTLIECEDTLAVSVSFDVIYETLNLTNLANLDVGEWVNIERAAKFGDEIGGHQLSGHVQSMATIEELKQEDGHYSIRMLSTQQWQKYLFSKGYVGLNGCSLTLGEVQENCFWVHLIPETLKVTNFSRLCVGDKINLEIDQQSQMIVDTVSRVLAQQAQPQKNI